MQSACDYNLAALVISLDWWYGSCRQQKCKKKKNQADKSLLYCMSWKTYLSFFLCSCEIVDTFRYSGLIVKGHKPKKLKTADTKLCIMLYIQFQAAHTVHSGSKRAAVKATTEILGESSTRQLRYTLHALKKVENTSKHRLNIMQLFVSSLNHLYVSPHITLHHISLCYSMLYQVTLQPLMLH